MPDIPEKYKIVGHQCPTYKTLRVTFGRMTTEEEVAFAADLIKAKIGKLRDLSPLWEMFKDGIDLSKVEWVEH